MSHLELLCPQWSSTRFPALVWIPEARGIATNLFFFCLRDFISPLSLWYLIYQHLTSAWLAMVRTKFDLKDILKNRFSIFEHISMLVIFVDTVLQARALANFNWI